MSDCAVMPGLTGSFGVGVTNCRSVSGVVSAVTRAEQAGAEIAFVAEDINCRDAFELAALCATSTDRIRLSTGVINPYTRNPTSIAMAVATLDEISNGRAGLGIGTSSPSLISDQMGLSRGKPAQVMREATEIVRALLKGGSVTYGGEYFRFAAARLDVRPVQEHIPIVFAAMGPRMLRLAGRLADGVLLNVGATTEYVRWAIGEIEVGAGEAGRTRHDLVVAAWLTAYVTDNAEVAMQRARAWLASMLSIPEQGELLLRHAGVDISILDPIRSHVGAYPHVGDRAAAAAFVPPEAAERMTLLGDRERVLARIEEYRAAGVDVPVLGIEALTALV